MLTAEENELLCRVEGNAPMGQMMRRHWTSVCLAEEVSEIDGTPVHVRAFGENLVVFRDIEGRAGVMDECCPPSRVPLVYGRNEECRLRYLYHGWKIDAQGNIIEMVSEPTASNLTKKVRHKAYETREWGGFSWAYMGPQDAIPEFVPPTWAPTAQTRVSIAKAILPRNWVQVLEGAIDSAHSSSPHSSDFVPARVSGSQATSKNWLRPSTDKASRVQVHRTSYGFRYATQRLAIQNASAHDYVRSAVFIAPAKALIPPNNLFSVANVNVLIDATRTAFYFLAWGNTDKTPETETWRKFFRQRAAIDLDDQYRPLRNRESRFWQDRAAVKLGHFTGTTSFPNQGIAMWMTTGPIANRADERLGASDLAVVEIRRVMLDALKKFPGKEAVISTSAKAARSEVCSYRSIIPREIDWRTFDAHPVWGNDESAVALDMNYRVQA